MSAPVTVEEFTAVLREADRAFEKIGGSTRHHVRDCLFPVMEREGMVVVRSRPALVAGGAVAVRPHTPAPWVVEDGDVVSRAAVFEGAHCHVASVADFEVDAALIAAAPDLLAALKGAVERAERLGGYVGQDGQFIKVMRAAIAKAEGRS